MAKPSKSKLKSVMTRRLEVGHLLMQMISATILTPSIGRKYFLSKKIDFKSSFQQFCLDNFNSLFDKQIRASLDLTSVLNSNSVGIIQNVKAISNLLNLRVFSLV